MEIATKVLVLFVVMNVLNVIIQTMKSIATIKCGKLTAAIINAVAYGLYTYIIILTNCDLPLLAKCLIVAGANFFGVFTVKFIEEKARKDKLWKIEATINRDKTEKLYADLKNANISTNYILIDDKYTVFNIYSETQADSIKVKKLLDFYNAKYFVSETKVL